MGSFLFSSHNKAQNLWLFHNFVLGVIGSIAIFFTFMFLQNEGKKDAIMFFMRFFPQVSFGFSLLYLGFFNVLSSSDDGDDDDFGKDFDPFTEPIRTSLIYMACMAVGYTVIVLLLER